MTKSVLVEKVSERIGSLTKKQTEIVVDTVFDSIKEALVKGEKIEIRGFGNFKPEISSQKSGNQDGQGIRRREKKLMSRGNGCCILKLGKPSEMQ